GDAVPGEAGQARALETTRVVRARRVRAAVRRPGRAIVDVDARLSGAAAGVVVTRRALALRAARSVDASCLRVALQALARHVELAMLAVSVHVDVPGRTATNGHALVHRAGRHGVATRRRAQIRAHGPVAVGVLRGRGTRTGEAAALVRARGDRVA